MKKFLSISALFVLILCLCSCGGKGNADTTATTTSATTKKVSEIYENSKFLGKWYNAYSTDKVADFELLADGTAIHKGKTKGTWSENGETITIKIEIDGKKQELPGYFIIAGDGFSCRATKENQHYL